MGELEANVSAFLTAACAPLDSGHASGTLDEARAILDAHPDVAEHNIHTAAVLGNDEAVRVLLASDCSLATVKGGPRGWDALTHLCFSRFLRLQPERSDEFVRAAEVLLDAGANVNTGWFERNHQPKPVWESAIYGAAGVAHHEGLTRLLLERGADPNDDETPYHVPENYDLGVLRALVESGKLNEDSLATILLRKADWHDFDAIKWLLETGVDPNRMTRWGKTALQQAVSRDNALAIVSVMLDHGADPHLVGGSSGGPGWHAEHRTSVAIAAQRGRGDVLADLKRRGIPFELRGANRLIAACALDDGPAIAAIASGEPNLVAEVVAQGGTLLGEFAGNGNTEGVRNLLALGVGVNARHALGDGYFGVAPNSAALHFAAWRARHQTVKFLIENGAAIDAADGKGRTPLALAIKACVDSYWSERRSPESVRALLDAGACAAVIRVPTGYTEVDALLEARGARRA